MFDGAIFDGAQWDALEIEVGKINRYPRRVRLRVRVANSTTGAVGTWTEFSSPLAVGSLVACALAPDGTIVLGEP